MKMFTQTSIVLSFCTFLTIFSTMSAKADVLSGDLYRDKDGGVPIGVTSDGTYFIAPFHINNHTTGQDSLIGFCGDIVTPLSSDFYNPNIGENYEANRLESAEVYSHFQKQCLQDLFDYAYGTLFLGEEKWNQFNAMAFQFAVWEIQRENWADHGFDINSGDFWAYPVGFNKETSDMVINTVNNWLSALTGADGITWESLGLLDTKASYNLTVYVAEGGKHASQTLIAVTSINEDPWATPEPTTFAILGLAGFGGLVLRRRHK